MKMNFVKPPSSPLAAFGLNKELQPTAPEYWNYERLSNLAPDQIISSLKIIPDMLTAKSIEMKTILPVCVKFCASHNAKVKKSACEALICCSERFDRPDVGLLAVNILMKDLNDPNPEVRATAVDTIASLSFVAEDHSLQAISAGIKDSNPRVRKAAVVGCGKVWKHSPSVIEENGMVDVLYTMVRDPDPHVLTFAIQTINVILSKEGGIVINSTMANYLISRLDDCQEKEKCFVLDYLHRHSPKNATARLALMNHIDPFIDSKNPALFLTSSKLFYKIMIDNEETRKLSVDFAERFEPQMNRFLKDPVNVEFQTALLQFLREMSKEDVLKHFTKHYKSFRMKSNDKPEVCLLKCELLVQISTSEHGQAEIDQEIIKYLCHQLTQSQFNSDVKSGILKALFRLPKAEEILGSELLRWIDSSPELTVPILVKNARIVPNHLESKCEVTQKMCEYALTYCSLNDEETVSAILWTLCHNVKMISGPYILEKLLDTIPTQTVIKSELLLLTGVKVFLNSPAESQHILGRIFQLYHQNGNNHDHQQKVLFYTHLLKQHADLCQKQINCSQ